MNGARLGARDNVLPYLYLLSSVLIKALSGCHPLLCLLRRCAHCSFSEEHHQEHRVDLS